MKPSWFVSPVIDRPERGIVHQENRLLMVIAVTGDASVQEGDETLRQGRCTMQPGVAASPQATLNPGSRESSNPTPKALRNVSLRTPKSPPRHLCYTI